MNNPLKFTDESGEFWNIIIGAAIGGVMNWATHGFKLNAKGLGYFGVGAAVGALSAMGGAWAASTFKAVGVAAGAGVGAVSGSVIGGASSVLLNGGNNLLSGSSFFNNWGSSFVSGAMTGAITGAIGGGISGYKEALKQGKNVWWGSEVKYGRTQWSFLTSEKPYEVVDFNIENVGSTAENDCVPSTFAEAEEYLGGEKTYSDFKTSTSYVEDQGVYQTRNGYENMIKKNFISESFNPKDLQYPEVMQQVEKSGDLISVNMKISSSMLHADNLRSISYYSNKIVLNFRTGSFKFGGQFFQQYMPRFFRLCGTY